jgi:hypothetical protein
MDNIYLECEKQLAKAVMANINKRCKEYIKMGFSGIVKKNHDENGINVIDEIKLDSIIIKD